MELRSTGGSIAGYLRTILGTYTPDTNLNSIAGVDWEYIFSGIFFILTVYFIFKFITLLFKK